jgi:hypothetical protein
MQVGKFQVGKELPDLHFILLMMKTRLLETCTELK